MSWEQDQEWEQKWWGTCANTFGEEFKQFAYAKRMGLTTFHDGKSPFNIDMKGASVFDIGGGPCSLLLKCHNLGSSMVIDPCSYPVWVYHRYQLAGIRYLMIPGESPEVLRLGRFDEVWIYNCLQHTQNPELILAQARLISGIVRIFEWIDTGTSPGHPHNLTEALLNGWLGGEGKVRQLNENTAVGKYYAGIFKGDEYGA